MAHVSLENFSSEGVLGRHQPQPKILKCTTDFSFLGCSLIVTYLCQEWDSEDRNRRTTTF